MRHFLISAFSLFLLLISSALVAQNPSHIGPCGTSRADLDALTGQLFLNMETLREEPVSLRSGAITYVPIKFHIVRKSDGSEGVPIENILAMLCRLNEFYADQEIQFFIKGGFNTINNNTLFDNPQSATGENLMKSSRVLGHLNIFITNQTGEANTLAYYTSGFPLWSLDFIVIRRSEISYQSNTIQHEVGHYFSLLHPFNGWECEPWDESLHGNPVNINVSPCNSLKSPYPFPAVEFVDGSNSSSAGDFLSDTPADYHLGLEWPNCNYNGGVRDPNGILLNPDEENVMGYFSNCADYHLSNMQKLLIATDLNSRKNASSSSNRHINTAASPILEDNGPVIALSPVNNGTSNGTMDIKLEWAAGAGAKKYIVRIDRFASFGFQPKYYYTNNPEVTLDFTLGSSGKYYWQVYPYNDYNTCPVWGETFSFTVGSPSSFANLPGLENFALYPQPLLSGQPLTMQTVLTQAKTLDMEIRDLNGRLLFSEKGQHILAGEQQWTPSWTPQHAGVYLLQLRSEEGLFTEKIMVQ